MQRPKPLICKYCELPMPLTGAATCPKHPARPLSGLCEPMILRNSCILCETRPSPCRHHRDPKPLAAPVSHMHTTRSGKTFRCYDQVCCPPEVAAPVSQPISVDQKVSYAINAHELDCKCYICTAFTNAGDGTKGYAAACAAVEKAEVAAPLPEPTSIYCICWNRHGSHQGAGMKCEAINPKCPCESNVNKPVSPLPEIASEADKKHEFGMGDGEFDEVFVKNAFVHVERMDATAFWMCIEGQGMRPIHIRTGVYRGTWYFNVEEDTLADDGQRFYIERPRSSKLPDAVREAKPSPVPLGEGAQTLKGRIEAAVAAIDEMKAKNKFVSDSDAAIVFHGRWKDVEAALASKAVPDEYRTISIAGVIRDGSQPCGWRNARAEKAEAELARLRSQEGVPDGVALIRAERLRQIEAEGWTPEHDDTHDNFQMADAAVTYILHATEHGRWQAYWPWDGEWFKPKNLLRDLTRAAALIVAEIDRIQRVKPAVAPGGEGTK